MRRLVRREGERWLRWEARLLGNAVVVTEDAPPPGRSNSFRIDHATARDATADFDALVEQRLAEGYVDAEGPPEPALVPAQPGRIDAMEFVVARRLSARLGREVRTAREAADGTAVALVAAPRGALQPAVVEAQAGEARELPLPPDAYVAVALDEEASRALVLAARACCVVDVGAGAVRRYELDAATPARDGAFAPGERALLFARREVALARLGEDGALEVTARLPTALDGATTFAATRDGRVVVVGGLGARDPEIELLGVYGDRLEALGRVRCDGRRVSPPQVWAASDTLCVEDAGGVREVASIDALYDPTLRAAPPPLSRVSLRTGPVADAPPSDARRAAALAALGGEPRARAYADAALIAIVDDAWPDDHPLRRLWALRARAAALTLGHALDLLARPPLGSLPVRGLDLSGCRVGARGLAELAASPALAALDALDLSSARVDRAAVEALTRSPYALNLRSLALADDPLDAGAVSALAECDWLQRLEALTLRGVPLDPDAVLALATSVTLTRLAALDVARCGLGPDEFDPLVRSTNLAACRRLRAADNPLGPRAADALQDGPRAALELLDLAGCALGDAGVGALARGAPFPRLRRLSLARNALGAPAIEALARATSLPALEVLDLAGNALDPAALDTLRGRPGLPRLREIERG